MVPPTDGGEAATEGTLIVVPTPQERAVQEALAEARALVETGDTNSLLRAYKRLVEPKPGVAQSEAARHPEGAALAARALVAFRGLAPKRLPEIVPFVILAHTLGPGTADSYGALGRGEYMRGNWDQAERAAAAGLTLDPLRVDLLMLRAETLAAQERWPQARTALESVLRAEPGNPDGLLLQATILWRYDGDAPRAIDVIQNAYTTHPDDPRFYELHGYILYQQGQREQARLVLGALLGRDPTRAAVARFLLQDAVERRRWTDALAYLEGLGSLVAEADLVRAQAVYRGLGDHERSIATAERLDGMALDRRYAAVYARSLLEAGAPSRALEIIAAALEVSRDGAVRSELYRMRAVASGLPLSENAVRDLQRALSENPSNADAMIAMARHFQSTGQPSRAHQYARSALRYRPDDPDLAELLRAIESALGGAGAP